MWCRAKAKHSPWQKPTHPTSIIPLHFKVQRHMKGFVPTRCAEVDRLNTGKTALEQSFFFLQLKYNNLTDKLISPLLTVSSFFHREINVIWNESIKKRLKQQTWFKRNKICSESGSCWAEFHRNNGFIFQSLLLKTEQYVKWSEN